MCQSYKRQCECGRNTAEIFFGNMLLNESAVAAVFCPECSHAYQDINPAQVWDNGWVLELDLDVVRPHAATFGLSKAGVTAEWVFDAGYATWVGITPDDTERRNRERDALQHLARTDLRAYIEAMKNWGIERERRFSDEGWRKMRPRSAMGL